MSVKPQKALGNAYRRAETRVSRDGCTVFVRLRVDRRSYEFARAWASVHASEVYDCTAEDQLEGYLNMALLSHMGDLDWRAAPEIEALFPEIAEQVSGFDDGIPF